MSQSISSGAGSAWAVTPQIQRMVDERVTSDRAELTAKIDKYGPLWDQYQAAHQKAETRYWDVNNGAVKSDTPDPIPFWDREIGDAVKFIAGATAVGAVVGAGAGATVFRELFKTAWGGAQTGAIAGAGAIGLLGIMATSSTLNHSRRESLSRIAKADHEYLQLRDAATAIESQADFPMAQRVPDLRWTAEHDNTYSADATRSDVEHFVTRIGKADLNGDAAVSLEPIDSAELRAVTADRGFSLDDVLSMDANHDHKLTPEESAAYLLKIRHAG